VASWDCDGPILFGTMPVSKDIGGVAIDSVTIDSFDWMWIDPCGTPSLAMVAGITIEATGAVPLHFCADPSVYLGSDPLGQFGPFVKRGDDWSASSSSGLRVVVGIPEAQLRPAYLNLAEPYPCDLVIQTNGGARRVKIPGFVGTKDMVALNAKLAADQLGCMKFSEAFWSELQVFQPWWPDDPTRLGVDFEHLWQVAVQGLAPGDLITLQDGRGQSLGTFQPGSLGLATMGVVATPVTGGPEMSIALQQGSSGAAAPAVGQELPAEDRGAAGRRRRLMIGQTPLIRMARLPFAHRVTRLQAVSLGGTCVLLCITDEGWHDLYDVSSPRLPTLMRRVSVPGLRGVTFWSGGGFVMWGEFGIEPLTAHGRCRSPERRRDRCLSETSVLDLADFGSHLYALRNGGLDIYADPSKKVGELELAAGGAGHLATVRGHLVIGDRRGLTVFTLDSPTKPRRIGALEIHGLASLELPPLVISSKSLLVRLEHGAEVVDLSAPEHPRALAHYAKLPWYSGTALVGKILARPDPQGYFVDLYRIGRTSTMG
jgi:hypothetical protein